MKRILFAGALMLAATGSTLAADLPPSMPPPPPPPRAPAYVPVITPQYNWGGIYVGINGGYGFGNSDEYWTSLGFASDTGSFSIKGPLVGGTLGANFQSGAFVFGIEGDGDWTNIKGSTSSTIAICPVCQTSNSWLATLRGRAGVAWDRVLLYATAGGAGGNINASIPAIPGFAAGSSSSTEFGWTAGAGLEFAITDNITAKVEYLYVDLQNGSLSCTMAVCGAVGSLPISFDANLVRAGLNLKFNPF